MSALIVPAFVAMIGCLVYAWTPTSMPHTKRVGEIMFFCGFFWLVASSAHLKLP